jgi:hypothetical protein
MDARQAAEHPRQGEFSSWDKVHALPDVTYRRFRFYAGIKPAFAATRNGVTESEFLLIVFSVLHKS